MKIKIILMLILFLVTILFLFPKDGGFSETATMPNGRIWVVGYRYKCLGIESSREINNRVIYKCFGFPHSKATF